MRLVILLLTTLSLCACALGLPSTTAEQEALHRQQEPAPPAG